MDYQGQKLPLAPTNLKVLDDDDHWMRGEKLALYRKEWGLEDKMVTIFMELSISFHWGIPKVTTNGNRSGLFTVTLRCKYKVYSFLMIFFLYINIFLTHSACTLKQIGIWLCVFLITFIFKTRHAKRSFPFFCTVINNSCYNHEFSH